MNEKDNSIDLIISKIYKELPKNLSLFILILLLSNFIFNLGYFYNVGYNLLGIMTLADYYEGTTPFLFLSFAMLYSFFFFAHKIKSNRGYWIGYRKWILIFICISLLIISKYQIYPLNHKLFVIFLIIYVLFVLFHYFTKELRNIIYGYMTFYLIFVYIFGIYMFHYDFTESTRNYKTVVVLNSNVSYPLLRIFSEGVLVKDKNNIMFFKLEKIKYLKKESKNIKK